MHASSEISVESLRHNIVHLNLPFSRHASVYRPCPPFSGGKSRSNKRRQQVNNTYINNYINPELILHKKCLTIKNVCDL